MSDVDIVRSVLEYIHVLPKSPKSPEEECKGKFNPQTQPQDYHLCVVDRNIEIHEKFRRQNLEESINKTNQIIGLTGDVQHIQQVPIAVAEHANYQVKNWVRIETAEKCLYLFYLTDDTRQLGRAVKFLETGLAQKDLTADFDIDRFSPSAVMSDTIFPVEAYFELKLTMLQVLSITDPVKALTLRDEIEADLNNPRMVTAQRSNAFSSQGYVNRLRFLKANLALYQNDPEKDDPGLKNAIAAANESAAWSLAQLNRSWLYQASYGLGPKDLIHDHLLAKVTAGKLLLRREMAKAPGNRNFSEALAVFQAVFADPAATQKYGGFLDLGMSAFTGLLQIAINSSNSRKETAEKFFSYISPAQIDALKDFKESLGLLLRHQTLWCDAMEKNKTKCVGWREAVSEQFLRLGKPQWSFADNGDVISEVTLSDPSLSDAEIKLGIIINCLQSSEVEKRALTAISNWWLATAP